MRAHDARHVLLLRAFEAPLTPPWTDADAQWASREAAQLEGEKVTPESFVARRAELAADWLRKRDPAIGTALSATRVAWWLGPLVVVLAAIAGVMLDAVGRSQRINILAPPMLGLIGWNLLVYVLLVAGWIFRRRSPGVGASGPLRRWLVGVPQGLARVTHPSLLRFMGDWAQLGRTLHARRAAAVLHGAAAALAIGVIVSLYMRGLSLEYRAGWESTFLSPEQVHRVVRAVFGPAAWIGRIPLPDVEQLAAIRFPGVRGENAARFINLWMLTLAIVVVLPRLLLGLIAARRAGKLANAFPLSLDDPYFQRIVRTLNSQHLPLCLLSYGVVPIMAEPTRLAAMCEQAMGQRFDLTASPRIEPGQEDDVRAVQTALHEAGVGGVLALFAATSTPERETHGRLLRNLERLRPGRIAVLIDESAFRARFTGAGADQRRDERRAAWRRMLEEVRLTPVFIDLSASAGPAALEDLAAALTPITR